MAGLNDRISYYSTNLKAPEVTFREALLKGLAPDGGLYMPSSIPVVSGSFLESLRSKTYPGVASEVMGILLQDEIEKIDLADLCYEAYNFSVPIERIGDNSYIMRLDQGPTSSFKDFAALMMGRLMQHFLKNDNKHLTILTATSGDTGGAVASAFHGLGNIKVIILFPEKEVTPIQRKQMTTLHGNVKAIAIRGKFDDCQSMVKKAFMDKSLVPLNLSSANSINIGRLLPQSVYYFWAWSRITAKSENQMIFSVPSGNLGNLAGGLIAREMGLPVKRMVISTNSNNEVPEYLRTGIYKPISPSINNISSAMNVGHPSNLARIIAFYGGQMDESGSFSKLPDLGKMRRDFYATSVSDNDTAEAIRICSRKYGIMLEPHGAVAWFGLKQFLKEFPDANDHNLFRVAIETAHPGKFREEVEKILGSTLALPDSLAKAEAGKEEYISLENNFEEFRNYMINKFN
jgi:threonine synthase